MEYIIVLCTINDLEKAKEIAKIIVEEKLAACANILPKGTSIYFWKEEVVEDEEYLMIFKTRKMLFEELKFKLLKLHPYDTPEVISVKIEKKKKNYLDWISSSTRDIL